MALCPPHSLHHNDAHTGFASRNTGGVAAMIEDFWSTDPEYLEWLDSQEEQDDD
jgi:hypothetical protein